VGNGGSSLNQQNGRFIDDSDIVIRIKSFVTEGFEEFVGTKTDIWFTKWFSFETKQFKKLWLPFIDPNAFVYDEDIRKLNECIFKNQFEDRHVNLKKHEELVRQIGYCNIDFLTEHELTSCLAETKIDCKPVYTKSGLNMYHPTTYLLAIFLSILRFPDHKVFITGRDNFQKGYYWNLHTKTCSTKTWPHQYKKEDLFIKKLIYNNKITSI
jgi:hypothetical protein